MTDSLRVIAAGGRISMRLATLKVNRNQRQPNLAKPCLGLPFNRRIGEVRHNISGVSVLARLLWLLFTVTVFSLPAHAQTGKRLELIIGNSEYQNTGDWPSLGGNPTRDAKAVAAILSNPPLSFQVTSLYDADNAAMTAALETFEAALATDTEIAFFYYAGHGAQSSFVTPAGKDIDAVLVATNGLAGTTANLQSTSIRLQTVMGYMRNADAKIIILDACRNSVGRGDRGLAPVGNVGNGYLIQYATGANKTAGNGAIGQFGLYTEVLLKHLGRNDLSVGDIFTTVLGEVALRNADQIPYIQSTLGTIIRWNPNSNPIIISTLPVTPPIQAAAIPKILSFDVSPRFIRHNQRVEVEWEIGGVDDCELEMPGSGTPKPISGPSGSMKVAVSRDGAFTLKCSGGGHTVTKREEVSIRGGKVGTERTDSPPQTIGNFCCDPNSGIRVCQLVQPLPQGAGCWCNSVPGSGFSCQ